MGHSIWMPPRFPLHPSPSSRRLSVEDRCLLSDSTVTPQDTHLLMMEDTPPPGTTGLDTWVPPDRTLQGGTKVVDPGASMSRPDSTVLTTRVLAGLMAGDRLITICQRGLTDPTCLTVQ